MMGAELSDKVELPDEVELSDKVEFPDEVVFRTSYQYWYCGGCKSPRVLRRTVRTN
jgi:hypothetical protein